jgi:ribokinase
VEAIARPGETISSTHFERRPGGKGANQAVAIAKALAVSGKVDFQCCVGEDGRWMIHQLEEMGVYAGGVVVVKVAQPPPYRLYPDMPSQEPTGRAVIQVAESGENCIGASSC